MLIALLLATLADFHPDSLSTSTVTIAGPEAHLSVRCGTRSLMLAVEGLDSNGDGDVSPAELHASEPEVVAYVATHYGLFVGAGSDFSGGERLTPSGGSAAPVAGNSTSPVGFPRGQLEVKLDFEHTAPIEDLSVHVTLFHEELPQHIDYSTLVSRGTRLDVHVLEVGHEWARLSEEGRGTFEVFFSTGWRHILSGWDHIAFVVALVLGSRRFRSLLAVVTAFTVAHSITLGLAAFGIVEMSSYAREIEAAVALSIAYVAVDCLVHKRIKRSRWVEAFLFGLVHGLAFASFLSTSLIRSQSKTAALFSFNLGVEVGQIAIVLGLALLLRVLPRSAEEEDPFLAPPLVQRGGLVVVAALGFWWFYQRLSA